MTDLPTSEAPASSVVMARATAQESWPSLGAPIKGPTALGNDPRRLIRLAWTLAFTDIKLRFFGSVLGYLWQLIRPLALFGVLYVVFTQFLSFGQGVKFYPVALLLGLVLFGFFAEATGQAVRSLVNREPLVRKIDFPRLAVPLATLMTALINLGLNLIPVFVFLLASGGRPRLSWLELPLLILGLAAFAGGLAMLLSALFVRYRDVEPIWEVVLQALFYAAPIFYTISVVREKTSQDWIPDAIMFNPFAAVLQQARHAVIDPSHEDPVSVFGDPLLLLVPIGITVAVLVIGFVVFNRLAPHIAEEL
ncbi:MAG: ABC transporter permease [Thermoleophilaceae bacterium]